MFCIDELFCYVCIIRQLFTQPLKVIDMRWSVVEPLPRHILCYFVFQVIKSLPNIFHAHGRS